MTEPRAASNQADAFDATIAQRIRQLCKDLPISAAELDRRAEFGPGTTGRLTRQDQRIYAKHLYRICQATGVGIGYFYGADTENTAPSSPEAQEQRRLLDAYMHIKDNATKRNVYELIETIADEYEENEGD